MSVLIFREVPLAILEKVSWKTFLALLDELGPHRGRLTYDRGVLEIMSPYREHERIKKLLARLIEALTLELGIDMQAGGSTTYLRPDLQKAVEPDECYYIAGESSVRGNPHADLTREPPPDLVVEVDIHARSSRRVKIYALMGVPEVWRHNGKKLLVRRLTKGGVYEEVRESVALPGFPIAEANRLIALREAMSDTQIVRAFLEAVRGKRRGRRRSP